MSFPRSSIDPERVKGGVVEIPPAGGEGAKVLPPFLVEGDHLPVQDSLFNRQFLPDPIAEFLEPF